jgi:hypothetical protein
MALPFPQLQTLPQALQYANEGAAASRSVCPSATADYLTAALATDFGTAYQLIASANSACDAEKARLAAGRGPMPIAKAGMAGSTWLWLGLGGAVLYWLLKKKK